MRDSQSHATEQVSHLSRDEIEFKKWTACPLWVTVVVDIFGGSMNLWSKIFV